MLSFHCQFLFLFRTQGSVSCLSSLAALSSASFFSASLATALLPIADYLKFFSADCAYRLATFFLCHS
uniref:Uncharacterized protein n=1 Tax=Myoviridae sp. ctCXW4 TaxID=2827669 RepID=A0A8S5TQ74_9CAUD|nr:MAG TPA: hypothetical protein [Myoviridae sp. ctCXW4]DAZ73467.1 MAG TPA: hypothetical protein [Caudoviricetes sp.]